MSVTRNSASEVANPTPVHLNILQPRITPSPTSCPPNTLVVQLTTTLVISNFNLFYAPTSIQSFYPTYTALADGSLVTTPFNQDQVDANLSLFVMGALAMVFARNILVSGDYIRRGKVKKKTLFHVLFLSQMLAPIAFIPMVLSYYTQRLNCTIVIILSCLSGTTSLALLITVILGVKVYKCLNNARFVPIILGLFQAASTTSVILDVTSTQGMRRLSGSCSHNDNLRFTRYFVIIQFLESLFICCCFIYVCWKSRGSPAARGRISLELSMDDLPIKIPDDPSEKSQPTRRGWWDYVPNEQESQQNVATDEETKQRTGGAFKSFLRRIFPSENGQQLLSSSQAKNTRLQIKAKPEKWSKNAQGRGDPERSRLSLAPSSLSRISRLVPRMELFQEVMKDELLYTTFITSTCVVVAVLAIIGVNFKNGLSVTGWIVLNWGIISLLAIHSFGRVVHRHERDALLQHPVNCTAIARTPNDIVKRGEQSTRRGSPGSISAPRARVVSISNENNSEDPFADSQALEDGTLDQENPFHSELDEQAGFTSSSTRLPKVNPAQLPRQNDLQRQGYLDFPTSDQRFSRSWIISASSNSNHTISWKSFREDET
ncbi:hypothetical protein CPB84DRAFT_464036 [Gymnopilus junonius]|uniref:Uncharacterized protein n=1 Tax=Gymnopilus junonius TaxID=109634 RepID=A0A9P5TT50_GYMJU|nr:hypothetical protein CPB84DRAFT_464036 [Gymnopilus junonius]